jgi:uncharacterized RDD family membrane protein YckC
MKCPKCDYLGFETGDRCKNCGYDFSLSTIVAAAEPELVLRQSEPFSRDTDRWLNQLEARLDNVRPMAMPAADDADPLASMTLDLPTSVAAPDHPVAPSPLPAVAAAPQVHRAASPTAALPLFQRGGADPDQPLIKVPSAPRPPLAVRRTPERPRLRTVAKPPRKVERDTDPVLVFGDDAVPHPRARAAAGVSAQPAALHAVEVSGPIRRLAAAIVDLLILLAIDAAVVYFTFKIAGLAFSSWQTIPVLPLALFLAMVKVSYFSVFTALGGQTVGKMATGIRVVADDDREVAAAQAVQRTLAAVASVATVGIGFAPVLLGGERRALHDRVAGTRVVGPLHE